LQKSIEKSYAIQHRLLLKTAGVNLFSQNIFVLIHQHLLHFRFESANLLAKKKADLLTHEEASELDAIGELDRIFTHVNAMIAAQNANQ
jgi:hypothetical protein